MKRREDLVNERVRAILIVVLLSLLASLPYSLNRAEPPKESGYYVQVVKDDRTMGVLPFPSENEVRSFLSRLGLKGEDGIERGLKVVLSDGDARLEAMDGRESILFDIPIDINVADVEDLTALPGIGWKLARRIVDRRGREGPFCSIDDLIDVRGIGRRKIERIRRFITVKPREGCDGSR